MMGVYIGNYFLIVCLGVFSLLGGLFLLARKKFNETEDDVRTGEVSQIVEAVLFMIAFTCFGVLSYMSFNLDFEECDHVLVDSNVSIVQNRNLFSNGYSFQCGDHNFADSATGYLWFGLSFIALVLLLVKVFIIFGGMF